MERIRRLAFRIAAGALLLGATLHVATVWPRVSALAAVLPGQAWLVVAGFAVSAATALLACGLALLLLWKAAERADARALTLFLGFLSVFWGSLFRFMEIKADASSISVTLSYGGGLVSRSALIALLMATAAFLRFSALFPRPLVAERLPLSRRVKRLRRFREVSLRPLPVWCTAAVVAAISLWLTDVVVWFAPEGFDAAAWRPMRISLFSWISAYLLFLVLAIATGLGHLRASYRTAPPQERARMLWLRAGFNVAASMVLGALGIAAMIPLTGLGASALGAAVPLGLVLAPLVLVVCAAIGILYAGAIDSALVLQKSTIYGGLGAVAVVTFAGVENALSNLIEQRLGLPGFLGAMVAGGLVTGALIPIRNLLLRRVARRPPAVSPDTGGAPPSGTTPLRPDPESAVR